MAGRPKGQPRTGGRKKGTLNKATADIKALARVHTASAISELARIMAKSESDAARVAAVRELLDRGHGKSAQPVTGEGGEGPVKLSLKVRSFGERAGDRVSACS